MSPGNTTDRYGSVAKTLHWLAALIIFTAIPLGLVANNLPHASEAELALKGQIFSLHKTMGVAAFAVGLTRIVWALFQTKAALLNAHRRTETLVAETTHWVLYASLVLVPLSGWLRHSASEGFAPILWPLGQSLPLVPKDPVLSEVFSNLHLVFTRVLAAAILLHVLGALKHHVWDRDATLVRMWFGSHPVPKIAAADRHVAPALLATLLWASAIGIGLSLGTMREVTGPERSLPGTGWEVTEGILNFGVRQSAAEIVGRFSSWAAAIDFNPETGTGTVAVSIDIASLSLGSVTPQALDSEFLDAAGHPTAQFIADIRPDGDVFVADGMLSLRGTDLPVALPFTLSLNGSTATAQGGVTLDRRTFGIGPNFRNPNQIGFEVTVSVRLTAVRTD